MCALFKAYLVLAVPQINMSKFNVVAVIHLADLKMEAAEDSKGEKHIRVNHPSVNEESGLQCHTALYSWKTVFESENSLFEFIFSACSAAEEEIWKAAIQEQSVLTSPAVAAPREAFPEICTTSALDLKPAGHVFGQAGTLARRLSIQRAATVGTRNNICQVIIRNTQKSSDSVEGRQFPESISRTKSLLSTHKTAVLSPKRSDRIRLEQALADVYSKEILPYPGMTGHRSGHLIRASAGSLVRKISRANMHTPFGRRSLSMNTVPTKQSTDKIALATGPSESAPVLHGSIGEPLTKTETEPTHFWQSEHITPSDRPRRMSFNGMKGLKRRNTTKTRRNSRATLELPMGEDGAIGIAEEGMETRKRWSNPLGLLRSFSSDGVRSFLTSAAKAT